MKTILSLIFACLCVAPLSASMYTFQCLSNNSGVCSQVAGQLTMDVNLDLDGVSFVLVNGGGAPTDVPSSVTSVYWFDGAGLLGSLFSPITDTGVAMHSPCTGGLPASPAGWPQGGSYNGPCATSNSAGGKVANGINLGEMARFLFPTATAINDIESALLLADPQTGAIPSNGIGVGLHVQSINGGTSDSMFLVPFGGGDVPEVPEPATLLFIGGGLALLGGLKIRRKA